MLGTFSRINSESLKQCIKNQDVTQTELANRLGVNIKTVQRWVNGHITKAKLETAEKMAEILNCSLEEITHSEKVVNVLVKNRILEELFARDIVHALHSNKHWNSYLNILKEFENTPIPTEQEALLFIYIGYIKYQLGLYRSAKSYLAKALEKSRAAHDDRLTIKSLCYASSNLLILGETKEARALLKEATDLNLRAEDLVLTSEILYHQSKISLFKNDFVTANELLRKSIVTELRSNKDIKTGLSLKYIQLARLQIRRQRYDLARKYYQRAEMHSHRSSVRTTGSVAHYGQALMAIVHKDYSLSQHHLRIARRMAGGKAEIQKSQKLLLIEFSLAIIDGNYELCKRILEQRYAMNRRSKMMVVSTVKTALLLDRVSKGAYPVRPEWLETATKYIETIRKNINYEQFRKLETQPHVHTFTTEELLDYLIL